jgi:glycosyltransferase involved in cell wall biosynthesis
MNVLFIVPCFNAHDNLSVLVESLNSQNDDRWHAILIDDISQDDTHNKMKEVSSDKISFFRNSSKKFALRNIVETSRLFQGRDDLIIAVIDGDDSLCNDDTVSLLINEYEKGSDVVWTGHVWDINNMNISKPMPDNVDPYGYPWCSSHLRTFKSTLLNKISDENFKNLSGEWFVRGYDQALMLPVLFMCKKRMYIDEICYRYNINSVSITDRSWEEMDQISTINIVRSRGFLE